MKSKLEEENTCFLLISNNTIEQVDGYIEGQKGQTSNAAQRHQVPKLDIT